MPFKPLSSSSVSVLCNLRGGADHTAAAAAERRRRKMLWRNPWADASAATADWAEGCQRAWQGVSLGVGHQRSRSGGPDTEGVVDGAPHVEAAGAASRVEQKKTLMRSRTLPPARCPDLGLRMQSTSKAAAHLSDAEAGPSRGSRRVGRSVGDASDVPTRSGHSGTHAASPSFSGTIAASGKAGCFPWSKKDSNHGSRRRLYVGAQSNTSPVQHRCAFKGAVGITRRLRTRDGTACVRRQAAGGSGGAVATGVRRRRHIAAWLCRFRRGGGGQNRIISRPQSLWSGSCSKLRSMRMWGQRSDSMHGPAQRMHSLHRCYPRSGG